MIKKTSIAIAFILLSFVVINASIDAKINGINKKIKTSNKLYKLNHQQFKELGVKIVEERKKLKVINRQLKSLLGVLYSSKNTLLSKSKQLKLVKKERNKVSKDIENIQSDFINHISKNLSLILTFNDMGVQNAEDMIEELMFKNYTSIINNHLQNLIRKLKKRERDMQVYKLKLKKIHTDISYIGKKLKKEYTLKKKQLNHISSLEGKVKRYLKKIKKINRNKKFLSTLLQRFKIQKKDIQKKQTNKTNKQKTYTATYDQEPDINIRQVNTSYTREKVLKYRGAKTIPPIAKYKIITKFGTSFDKVYNIKTFNRSVILKSKIKNQKVRTVLKGVVVFADDTPTLKKTIIIKHPNGYHTIYADLSDIAPSIKRGRSLKKGYVIGRVSDELHFEVVKKNYYIDPMRFIK